MDEIHNKTDREILVEVHTVVRGIVKTQKEVKDWQEKHESNDNKQFSEQSKKINFIYVGIAAVIMLLGWIKFSIAG